MNSSTSPIPAQLQTVGMSDEDTHPRMTLNNWVQGRFGRADDLTSEELLTGPRHAATWVVIVYFRSIEYGRGTSTKKNAAKDQAAERALAALQERFDQEQQ